MSITGVGKLREAAYSEIMPVEPVAKTYMDTRKNPNRDPSQQGYNKENLPKGVKFKDLKGEFTLF